ncbi:hypothetical protein [Cellulomonas sp.]|uniref:hypothetical protein n=1 Tax=Cellulomonas sp. TaxID=40001 RepID=UPI00258C04D4|nr:hypothetical protein [Cellulomonas sp.]MCR6688099.1 hypothetical protein [Cellulomonas sp.]
MRSAHAGGEHQATLPFVAALWGAVSVAYAAAFGGEPHPPGVLVGIYLGAQGALVGACTWGVWWGLAATSTAPARARRAVAYAFGRSLREGLRDDGLHAARTLGIAAGWGAAGGLCATVGWSVIDARWSIADQAYAVSATGIGVLVLEAIAWMATGYVLGTAFRRAVRALLACAVALLASIAAMGFAYFSPALTPLILITPLALPLTAATGTAGPYTSPVSMTAACASAIVWAVLAVAAAVRSARTPLLDSSARWRRRRTSSPTLADPAPAAATPSGP